MVGYIEKKRKCAWLFLIHSCIFRFTCRTNTVVVIDANNYVTYVERTMEEPINVEKIRWNTNRFEFKIDPQATMENRNCD